MAPQQFRLRRTGSLSWCLLYLFTAIGCAIGQTPELTTVPNPIVSSISPASITQGNTGFSITVKGTNFVPGASVAVDDFPVPTSFVSSTQLTGTVPARFLTNAGQVPISVHGPTNLGSNQLLLTVVPAPSIAALTPQTVDAGSLAFTLTVVGSQFVPGSAIRIGSVVLNATYLGPSQLTVSVPASLLSTSGRFVLVVVAPDGALSNEDALIVAPVLTSVGNVQISGTQVTVDVTGAGFVPIDLLALTANGIQYYLPTTFINSTKLRAAMTADALKLGHGLVNVTQSDSLDSRFLPFALPLTIDFFTPAGAFAGGPSFNLVVSGGIFPAGSLVLWNDAPLATSVVILTQLTATVPASRITASGVANIRILHPSGNSVSMPYAINSGLTLSSLSPNSAFAGDQPFTLTLNGGGFLAGAVVRWNGTALPTTVLSSTQLTAAVTANLIASVGVAVIGILEPGGPSSNLASFAILPPPTAAGITALTPAAATAGGPDLVLTVNGSGFVAASGVLFNGSALKTTFVGSGQLVATVPAALIASPGTARITVTSGSAVSAAATFAVLSGPPVTSAAAIVNLGSPTSPMAPGSLFSIYGSGLAIAPSAASATPLPGLLNNVSVLVNGIFAPLLYVSPTQINAQVPFEAPPGLATLVVNIGGVASTPVIFQLQSTGPGVWTRSGDSHTLAVNDTDGSLVTPAAPVAPGTYVTFYLTGQGPLDNPVPTGAAAPPSPLSIPNAPMVATLGGNPVDLVTALAPGLVGILQVNILIPDLPAGDQALALTIGGVPSNVSYLSIAAR